MRANTAMALPPPLADVTLEQGAARDWGVAKVGRMSFFDLL